MIEPGDCLDRSDCTEPSHPLPAQALSRYSPIRDPDSEQEIAVYVEAEAGDEQVLNVEKVKSEIILGDTYDVWDVITNKDRWWVITNITNLYSQQHFPSLDYTLSFHVGLMLRLRSRAHRPDHEDPSPFDDVFRRLDQAESRLDSAIESEDYQAVGLLLRECLIALVGVLRRRITLPALKERPHGADFVGWSALLTNQLCPGDTNADLRQYLKNTAKSTWQLVNWLTHSTGASKTPATISIHACHGVVGHYVHVFVSESTDSVDRCPMCRSSDVRSHYDPMLSLDGAYYLSCAVCGWTDHPGGHRLAYDDSRQTPPGPEAGKAPR